jgi:hypothetical protein
MIIVEESEEFLVVHRDWALHLVLLHHVGMPRASAPEWRLALYYDTQLDTVVLKKLLRRDGAPFVKPYFIPLRADVLRIGPEDLESFQHLFAGDLNVLRARIAEVQLSQGKDQDIEF